MGGVAPFAFGGGRHHDRAALGAVERVQRVQANRAARVQALRGHRGRDVVAERRDDDQRIGVGPPRRARSLPRAWG
ncbi:hypothetical protein G6F40_017951 [Rhizopus arrhizus]|nr:hypothetical protein G6F40_017951 [Rhizopus arrhizus]